MANGFQSWNANGTLQIDNNYPVLSYRGQGSATLTTLHPASNSSMTQAKYVDLTITSNANPLLAIYGPSSYGILSTKKLGNQWSFRVIGIQNQTVGNPPFQWVWFDRPVSMSAGSGAEAFGSNGACVFSTSCPPISVRGFIGDGLNSTGYYDISLPASRKYGVIFTSRISLFENSEHFTNQEVYTYWNYDLATAFAENQPSPYDASVKRCGMATTAINSGVYGGYGANAPTYPGADLGGWGAASTVSFVDLTDYV